MENLESSNFQLMLMEKTLGKWNTTMPYVRKHAKLQCVLFHAISYGKLLFTRKAGDISPVFCCKVTVHGIPISKTVITKVALLLLKASESSAKMIF